MGHNVTNMAKKVYYVEASVSDFTSPKIYKVMTHNKSTQSKIKSLLL